MSRDGAGENRAFRAVDTSRSPFARLVAAPVTAVRLADGFWEPRRRVNRERTLLSQWRHLEETGAVENFRRALDPSRQTAFTGWYFSDSDVYKWLEAAASALAEENAQEKPQEKAQAELRERVNEAIALIGGAQRADGYLNTYFAREREGERWINLRDLHEMYCAGHLLQAAVAHHRATGETSLLQIAVRVADNLDTTFGPEEKGKRPGVDGHPEIEMALVELYRATGEARYLRLAEYLVGARGRTPSVCYSKPGGTEKGTVYHQDHVPFRELSEVCGHAVRMLYLAAGAADVVLETGEEALQSALVQQWNNMTTRRMYVSGGIGARWEGEAFGEDYELPSGRAYTETCAAIASVMTCHRLLLLTGEAKYADLLEWTLLNAVLPGLSLSGEEYFYQNPLEDSGKHRRKPWFGCACCPPNVARLLAQLPGYFCGTSKEGVYLHLYAEGRAALPLGDGAGIALDTKTAYPFDGEIKILVTEATTEAEVALFLRVPGWCDGAQITVNEEAVPDTLPGTYAVVRRVWRVGDVLHLQFPMPPRLLEAHPHLTDAAGRAALARGPLLYCAEAADNGDVRELALRPGAEWETTALAGLPQITALRGPAQRRNAGSAWGSALYRPVSSTCETTSDFVPQGEQATLIPYFAWANREPGQMAVWLRRAQD